MSTLIVDERPDRVFVTLNRPDARNAIDQAMVDELHEVCARLEAAPKALIISGAAGIFASGADIRQLRDRRREDALAGINTRLFMRVAALPMPVIAAIDGYALGGGAELAYAADFRIATPSLRIGNPETTLGIIAAAGATWRLPQLVGEPVAKQILLAGRVLDADEALALHLISEIHEPDALLAASDALADRILRAAPAALQATKALLADQSDGHVTRVLEEQAVLFESDAKYERMTAFLERKKNGGNT